LNLLHAYRIFQATQVHCFDLPSFLVIFLMMLGVASVRLN
jgi:hypothetical protein